MKLLYQFFFISLLTVSDCCRFEYNTTLVTNYLNELRIKHQAPKVKINNDINYIAQQWADYLHNTEKFEHSPSYLGENLAILNSALPFNYTHLIINAINAWYAEVSKYNYSNPVYASSTGHFTQLVWINTRNIGIGINAWKKAFVVVMMFDPPGNVKGMFKTNVLPIRKTKPSPMKHY
jgi:uncharacterized protein YkwD